MDIASQYLFEEKFGGAKFEGLDIIMSSLTDLILKDSPDVFSWSLHSIEKFSVKSMYAAIVNNGARVSQEVKKFGVQRCQLKSRSL